MHIDEIKITRKKIKNFNLRIDEDGNVKLSVPYSAREKDIEVFINKYENWINNKLDKISKKNIHKKNNENMFLFLGQKYEIKYVSDETESLYLEDNICHIVTLNEKNIEKIKYDFYYTNAKTIFTRLVRENLDKMMEKPISRLSIKKMKTRWGSCNYNKRTINLNIELIKYDIEAIEYVVIHEIAHLKHPNHSINFWNHVAKYCSNYKEEKKKLKYKF